MTHAFLDSGSEEMSLSEDDIEKMTAKEAYNIQSSNWRRQYFQVQEQESSYLWHLYLSELQYSCMYNIVLKSNTNVMGPIAEPRKPSLY